MYYELQLQKEIVSIQTQPSCEKSARPKMTDVKLKGGGQQMAVIIV